uniref:NADH-ubiquinone oxidoreductase chain 6 n=1 Tax=Manticora tibialis TaxID=1343345 RepID=A0A343EZ22_9CARA|nr:NADH dehydrogenase subunit 6 [Manticora tibialis]ASN65999.1 NADH dehydrogenase subunit 6 [Manticora tibialis]
MFMTLLSMNMIMTTMFMFMNHPMSMGLILLIQTILISSLSGMLSFSFWFSYILFLIMIGGMLVLFMYMTSLASNEMFNLSIKLMIMAMTMSIIMISMLLIMDYMINIPLFKNIDFIELINQMNLLKNENIQTLNKIYNIPNNLITLILINYLFLTLIAVVKITDVKNGPLRQKF